jgi:glycosyltransferase involved in cell wall biosynthesis
MRILIATQHLEIVGGVETYLRAVIPLLVDQGFEVAVLGEIGSIADGLAISYSRHPAWSTAGKAIRETLKFVVPWHPDVVFCHGLSDSRLEAALAEHFPTVFFVHGYVGTCVSGTKCHSRPDHAPCRRTLGLGCLAAYLPRGCGGRSPVTMLARYRSARRRLQNLKRYPAVLVASNHMAQELLRHGLEASRVKIVPCFPTEEAPDPEPPKPRPRSNRVLFVGRISPWKGLHHLIEAMPQAEARLQRKLKLIVAGDGSDRMAAENAARDQGVNAEFLGWVTPERRREEMRRADILVVPSLWPEPFGLVGIEAGCVGLPAVGYASGGIPDWLHNGVSGQSAPGQHPDPQQLCQAIVRALSDDNHWEKLRLGAWKTAHGFGRQSHLQRLISIFEETVIQSRRKREDERAPSIA